MEKAAEREARAVWQKKIDDLEQKLTDAWDDYLSHHYETTGEELKDKDPDFLKMAQREVGPFFFNRKTKKASFKPTSPMSAREIFSKGVLYKGKGRRRVKAKRSRAKRRYSDSDLPVVGLRSRPTPLMLQRQSEEQMAQQNYLSKMKGMKGRYKNELEDMTEKMGGRRHSMSDSDSESDEEMRGGGYSDIIEDLKNLFSGEVFFSQLRDETKKAIADIPVFPDVPNWEFSNKPLSFVYKKYGRVQHEKDLSVFNFLEENPIVEQKIMEGVMPRMNADAGDFVPEREDGLSVPEYRYNDKAEGQFVNLPSNVMSVVNMADPSYTQRGDNSNVDSFFGMGQRRNMPRFHSREYHGRGRLGFDTPLPGSTRGW